MNTIVNMKERWQRISEITNSEKMKINKIYDKWNNLRTDTTDITNSFNEYFRKLGEKIRDEIRHLTSKNQNDQLHKISLNKNLI